MLGLADPSQYVVARLEIDYVDSLVLEDAAASADITLERIGNTSLTVRETMRDTAQWDAEHGTEVSPTLTGVSGAGLAPERERELLAAWHERT